MAVSAPTKERRQHEQHIDRCQPSTLGMRPLGFIVLTVTLQIVALLFTEFFLFIAGLGEEEIYAFDPDLGTKHMTNKRITWRSEGFGRTDFDANGMQEPNLTVEKPANTYRIAILGDSTVEGLQVPKEAKFPRILDRTVKLNNGKQVQFLNFGTSGYSTVQEYVQLQKSVFQFAPDLVVLCYDTRDMFENWAPPDATMTNLRPVAIQVPNGQLVISNIAVKEWLKSPRGRFLSSISWLRQSSRIWGLISATETELSFKNEVYKVIIGLLTSPANTVRKLWSDWSKPQAWSLEKVLGSKSSGPSFRIQFFEGKDPNAQVGGLNSRETIKKSAPSVPNKGNSRTAQQAESGQAGQTSTAGSVQTPAPTPTNGIRSDQADRSDAPMTSTGSSTDTAPAGTRVTADTKDSTNTAFNTRAQTKPLDPASWNFVTTLSRTLSALISGMNDMCNKRNVKFAVVALPARVSLSPNPGEEIGLYGVTFEDEVSVVNKTCKEHSIPFCDLVPPALKLPESERKELFYAVHLTPKGHEFIAGELKDFMIEQAGSAAQH